VHISISASRANPKFAYYIFIPADIVSLVLQAAGGAMSASSSGGSSSGVSIALAGLILQVVTLSFFVLCVLDYMYRARAEWWPSSKTKLSRRFINFCGWLALTTVLILIRCVYRVYELSEGYSRESEALRDQALFNGLEGV
jgi:ascorbate-specific PTS system EIIC-type component UlaA